MEGNSALHRAKDAKKDEFYTQLSDIEAELRHYEHHFNGKIVLCNCDDPYESNFFKYFALQFNRLKLKKLIATCYDSSPIVGEQLTIFPEKRPYMIQITEVIDENGDGAIDLSDVAYLLQNRKNVIRKLKDGDFRSAECVDALKEADIVVTNPPFSLFREYVALLMRYEKKFLIIGNQNAITYKEIFPLIQNDRIWLGMRSGDMAFTVPDYYEPRPTRYWVDSKGQKWRSMGNISWYTNLDHPKRHEPLDLWKEYNSVDYPHYDNYDAIDVSQTANIPCDYWDVMGVPITFLDKYSPDQFEIVGITLGNTVDYEMTAIYKNAIQHNKDGTTQGGSKVNTRAAILVKDRPKNTVYYTADGVDGYLLSIYPRILIRRISHENQAP